MLHDACSSADTAVTRLNPFHGVTELIAACGFESTAPGPGPNSFTAALTTCLLNFYASEIPFSVSELFSKVLARLRNTGIRNNTATPVHSTLNSDKSGRRILLEPLRQTGSQPAAPTVECSSPMWMNIFFSFSGPPNFQAWKDWILNAPVDAVSVDLGHPDVRIE